MWSPASTPCPLTTTSFRSQQGVITPDLRLHSGGLNLRRQSERYRGRMAGDERFSEEVQAKIVQVAMDPSRWKMTKAQRGRTLAGLSIVREFLGGEEVYGPGDAADEIIQLPWSPTSSMTPT
jgi:hypothetical protein